jgi:hypothetical protein
MGFAFLSITSTNTSVKYFSSLFAPMKVILVFQTKKPIGKSPFNPSKALLWVTNPSKYFTFQASLNFSKLGAFTYFNLLNIASVAVGISLASRTKN